MIKELKHLISFLTIFPVRMDEDLLSDCAKAMFLFPLIGAFIGLIAGFFGWIAFQFLPSSVAGVLILGLLLVITGLHHTDGLLDFGDAIMAHGSPKRKIEIMHDQLTGAGGLSLGIMTFLITAIAFSELNSTRNLSTSTPFLPSTVFAKSPCTIDSSRFDNSSSVENRLSSVTL